MGEEKQVGIPHRATACGRIRTQGAEWRNFLLNPNNKMTLTEFVVKGWRRDNYKYRTKLMGKVIFMTCESH